MTLAFEFGVISGCLVQIHIRLFPQEQVLLQIFKFRNSLIRMNAVGIMVYWKTFFSHLRLILSRLSLWVIDCQSINWIGQKHKTVFLLYAVLTTWQWTCHLIQRVALAHMIAIFVNFGSNYRNYQFPIRYVIIGTSSMKSYVRNVKWEMNHWVISFGFVQELVECGTFLSCLVYNVMPILTVFMTISSVLWW